jgi:hypothetical protein
MAKYRELSPDELAALQSFAAAHGRGWKEILAYTYWYNARVWNGLNVLHSIRNDLGPVWLARFQLPKDKD